MNIYRSQQDFDGAWTDNKDYYSLINKHAYINASIMDVTESSMEDSVIENSVIKNSITKPDVKNTLRPYKGCKVKINGVIIINNQLAGLEVSLITIPDNVDNSVKDLVFQSHIKNFYIDGMDQISQQKHIWSWMAIKTKYKLQEFTTPQTFHGSDWAGIEKMYYMLGTLADKVLIEKSPGTDSWCIILPPAPFSSSDKNPVSVVVNCQIFNTHSFEFPDDDKKNKNTEKAKNTEKVKNTKNTENAKNTKEWTLSVTITEVSGAALNPIVSSFAREKYYWHKDPWVRSMIWSLRTVIILNYSPDISKDMKSRLLMAREAYSRVKEIKRNVFNACKKVKDSKSVLTAAISQKTHCFREPLEFPPLSIMVSKWSLPAGKIGMYVHPLNSQQVLKEAVQNHKVTPVYTGCIVLHPGAFSVTRPGDNSPYYEYILKHELIHSIFGENCVSHNSDFYAVADAVGLPKKYQD